MYSTAELVLKYLSFYWEASHSKGHGVHSPFVFEFIQQVLQNKTTDHSFAQWKDWRANLLHSTEMLSWEEIGGGSRLGSFDKKSVAAIVNQSAKPIRTAKLFYKLVQFYQPNSILELGTSLGLSTALFSLARPTATIHTIEGVSSAYLKALTHFQEWQFKNVHSYFGNFDNKLTEVLNVMPAPELVFMDGNHQEEPTLRYFEQLVNHLPEQSIVIVDDIRWSAGMERAWKQIQQHEQVTATIDLFQFGIVLFRPSFHSKLHYRIRF